MKYKAFLREIGRIIYEFSTIVNLSKRGIIEHTTVVGKRPKMRTVTLIAVIIIVAMLTACSFVDANIEIEPTYTNVYTPTPNDEHQLIPSKELFEALLKWDESRHIGEDGFSRNYIWKDNRYFYEFSNKDVIINFPLTGEENRDVYTIIKGDRQGVFNWKNTYYPTSKSYLAPKLMDVTGDGFEDLCVVISIGSGTGVSLSVVHVVDLATMKEIPILEQNDCGDFTMGDAIIIRDFLKNEKDKHEELLFLDDIPQTNYSIRGFDLCDNTIKVDIGINNYEEFVSGVAVGILYGEYIYNGHGFTLSNLNFVGCSNSSVNEGSYDSITKSESSHDTIQKTSIESNKDWLKSVSFVSSEIGFISLLNSSSDNCLLKTTDGGNSWEIVNSCKNLYALCFASSQTGYAIENLGGNNAPQPVLVKTVNGGVDWDVMPFIDNKNPVEINCINESIIFVAASNNTNGLFGGLKYEDSVFVSSDGASTWQEIQTPKEFCGEGMSWVSPEEGYLMDTDQPGAGLQPKILYHTTNAGKSWEIIAKSDSIGQNSDVQNVLPIAGYPNGIKFFKSGTGYIGSSRAIILKTTNMGKTFSSVSFNDNSDVRPVPCFISENEGFAINSNSKLFHTIDGGDSCLKIWP